MFDQSVYALILSGGEGKRLAPLSSSNFPKQFVNLFGNKNLIEQTYDRIKDFISNDRILVSTNCKYVELVKKYLPNIPPNNLISESQKKNTAPALALAAHILFARNPKSIMISLPADHVILKPNIFLHAIKEAVAHAATNDNLVTLGIRPDRAATEYGYIAKGERITGEVHKGLGFYEKPDLHVANTYFCSGNFLWNAGIFIWRTEVFLKEVKTHLPEIADLLKNIKNNDDYVNFFNEAQNISVDYGIMEQTKNVSVIPTECEWSDVGTWEGLQQLSQNHSIELSREAFEAVKKYAGRPE